MQVLALDKFWGTLVMFDHFWDFDKLVKVGVPRPKWRSWDLSIFASFWGFRVYVMGMGCQTMGFSHV